MGTYDKKRLLDKLRMAFAESFPEIDLCRSCIHYAGQDKSCSTQSGVCEWVPDDVFLNRFINTVRKLLNDDSEKQGGEEK